ncbi:hypothetical protein M231_06254 [Tremella mesenterica]|uniref:Uncharacterized protein n=1 Tax=Tremella mesenterica TaxID=5217 RepID=A0A4V1M3D3_TREME|nr:uncharacterized protein TREMEDRAFT_62088 [Tremella mesenterica DSM 1558]XP_007008503.1 uncharacterized protein TREMEDRAFT_66393 [Tremella mesenterica DSM 1558]XP_007008686.1 uncharacterized protein TREMEDRAFT_66597 [Tremella mesenterica DSM 1558]RXK36470.1 hypothetical protein M231_06254 [Tremella mesenterica]EIW65425.1 hypothetical protein TREMEDRAFT_66597 [Tremella mesenterica DSM 1558]EIW65664.1 hypothetical protein TREMEDRAFT_66393 [Tremella mesenterica DSM 1558]EIW69237.1 hypothetical
MPAYYQVNTPLRADVNGNYITSMEVGWATFHEHLLSTSDLPYLNDFQVSFCLSMLQGSIEPTIAGCWSHVSLPGSPNVSLHAHVNLLLLRLEIIGVFWEWCDFRGVNHSLNVIDPGQLQFYLWRLMESRGLEAVSQFFMALYQHVPDGHASRLCYYVLRLMGTEL